MPCPLVSLLSETLGVSNQGHRVIKRKGSEDRKDIDPQTWAKELAQSSCRQIHSLFHSLSAVFTVSSPHPSGLRRLPEGERLQYSLRKLPNTATCFGLDRESAPSSAAVSITCYPRGRI